MDRTVLGSIWLNRREVSVPNYNSYLQRQVAALVLCVVKMEKSRSLVLLCEMNQGWQKLRFIYSTVISITEM